MTQAENPFAALPEPVRLGQRLSLLASEIGELSVEVVGATDPNERRALAQRLRALADSVETAG